MANPDPYSDNTRFRAIGRESECSALLWSYNPKDFAHRFPR